MKPDRASAGVSAAGIVTFLNLYSVQALLPTLAQEFDAPLSQTGLTMTAPLLSVAMVAPFVGSASDMLGRKKLIVWAAFLLVAPAFCAGLARTLPGLILARFAQGLLLPFIFTVTVAYIGDERRGPEALRLIGRYSMGSILGGYAGRQIAGVVAQAAGWRAAFFVIAGLTGAGACIIAAALPLERRFRAERSWASSLGSLGEHLRNRALASTFLVGFSVLFAIVAAFTYANFLLAAPPYHLGPAALGSIFVVYLAGMFSAPASARIAARFGRRATVAGAAALGAGGMALTLAPNLACIIAGLGLLAAAVFVEQTMSLSFVGAAAERAKSAAVGLYVTCYYIGGSCGAIAPAGIWHLAGWPGCVALVAAAQLLTAALAWAAWRQT
jgi:predicted MFS family arabinose efflux permease